MKKTVGLLVATALMSGAFAALPARAAGDDPGYSTITVQAQIGSNYEGHLHYSQDGCLVFTSLHGTQNAMPVVISEMVPGDLSLFTSNINHFLDTRIRVGAWVGPPPTTQYAQFVHESPCTASADEVFYLEELPALYGDAPKCLKILKRLAKAAKLPTPVYFANTYNPVITIIVNNNKYYRTLRARIVKAGLTQFYEFSGPGTVAPKKKVKH